MHAHTHTPEAGDGEIMSNKNYSRKKGEKQQQQLKAISSALYIRSCCNEEEWKNFSPPICSEHNPPYTHTHTPSVVWMHVSRDDTAVTHRHDGAPAVALSVPWCLVSRVLRSVSHSTVHPTNHVPENKNTQAYLIPTHTLRDPITNKRAARLLHKVNKL